MNELARKAHYVKSSSTTIGAMRIAQLCHQLQIVAETQCGFVEEQRRQAELLNSYLVQYAKKRERTKWGATNNLGGKIESCVLQPQFVLLILMLTPCVCFSCSGYRVSWRCFKLSLPRSTGSDPLRRSPFSLVF